MRHHIFEESPTGHYKVAVLIKGTAFNKRELEQNYVEQMNAKGVAANEIIAFTLAYNESGKAPAAYIKGYLDNLLPALDGLGVTMLYVADSAYFKTLAGKPKAETHLGYVLPCAIKGYEHMSVVLGVNYQALIYNPELRAKLDLGITALTSSLAGNYQAPGADIIHSASYPSSLSDIAAALQSLHQYPSLTCDIEGFSLRFNECGIGTIAFAWDQHNGVAFACDYQVSYTGLSHQDPSWPGSNIPNPAVRALLLEFFTTYKGELTFHHAPFDAKAIIYALWMSSLSDTKGLLVGLDVLTKRMHDTKIISYLATNSTAGNVLGLKAQAHEFAGNWAVEDIKDIRRIPLDKLLQYNLVDALSTHYVRNKHWPTLVSDQQQGLYEGLMLSSLKLIIQLELTGMPMSRKRILEVKAQLEGIQNDQLNVIRNSPYIKTVELLIRHSEWEKDFEDRRSKAKNPGKIFPKQIERFDSTTFNPNSGPQLQRLLHEVMGLPVLDKTDTGQPATGAETIEKLINHTADQAVKDVLKALISYAGVTTILTTFIPAFEGAISKDDSDTVWLHGCFNLGGTVSGRLSSSDPNLQNIPANVSVWVDGVEVFLGKLIKSCFVGPMGWLFAGADFKSLEDYISALTTKDPNKLKVYIDGFDGHCLRAAYYFRDQCPDIDPTDPKSVNSMKKLYPVLRQDSKAPTFLLTYGGTYHGMMSQLGWDKERAMAIEAGYHEMYKVSDQYIQDRLKQASKDGYVTVAFGLRVRTPLLAQVVFGGPKMPYAAAAEGRTAGNALGQSYGLLNNRAAVEFMQKVWASKYRYDILPVGLIHDAIYILIKDNIEVVEWANRELIKSMQWQELPEIQHPVVKLGAALDLFWPSWANATTLPNGADKETIVKVCKEARTDYMKPEKM